MSKKKGHVIGMTKSSTDLIGAKNPKLELDFLRLVYVVKELRSEGLSAKGCLVVMSSAIAGRVEGWGDKYKAGDAVEVVVASLSTEEMERLYAEKKRNVEGMIDGTQGGEVAGRSDANDGKKIGEEALRKQIQFNEPDIVEMTDKATFPFSIDWDYYGTSDDSLEEDD